MRKSSKRSLPAGADPNAVLPGGETVFMTAARTGRIEVVEALYEAGADVDFREPRRGQTALMWAVAEGNLEVVELLLEVGADPNATLDSGYTPLLFAVREGGIEVTEALLRAGVDVNAATPRKAVKRDRPLPGGRSVRPGSTPLLVAVTNGHFELAARLLDAGADPNAAHPGYTALHMLARVRKPGTGDNNPRPDGSGSMDGFGLCPRHGGARRRPRDPHDGEGPPQQHGLQTSWGRRRSSSRRWSPTRT